MTRHWDIHSCSSVSKLCVHGPTTNRARAGAPYHNESHELSLLGSFQVLVPGAVYAFACGAFPLPVLFIISCYLSSEITSVLKCNEKLQNEIFQNIMFYPSTHQ